MSYNFADRTIHMKTAPIREMLKLTAGNPDMISFAAGNPAPEAFPVKEIEEITVNILRTNPIVALQYNMTDGYAPLRKAVTSDLKDRFDIGRDFDNIIITSGAQQGIEQICRVLCNEGDTVICENPSFAGSLNAFKAYGVNLVPVDMESDGISIEKLEQALIENPNTKYIYLIPTFHNPTSITMSLEKRHACYELAKKYGVLILEDNPYGELRFRGEHLPAIKSFDEDGIVIYCGSFSKVISPGIRVGFVFAHKKIISKINLCKQIDDVHTNILSQMICYEFMTNYDFVGHINGLQAIYLKKYKLMFECMEKHLHPSITYNHPDGGLFIWCTLPDGIDMMAFQKACLSAGVAIVPGTAFLADDTMSTNSFRLNYSTPSDEQIIKGIEIVGKVSYQMIENA